MPIAISAIPTAEAIAISVQSTTGLRIQPINGRPGPPFTCGIGRAPPADTLLTRPRMPLRSTIRRRPLLVVLVISAVVGLAAAKVNSAGDLQLGVATAHVMVDYPTPSLVQRRAL